MQDRTVLVPPQCSIVRHCEPKDWQDNDCSHEGCSHVCGDNNWNDAGCGGNRAAICGFNDAWIQPHSGR